MFRFQRVHSEWSHELVRLWVETFTQAYKDMHSPENIQAYCAKHYSIEAAIDVLSHDENICLVAYKEAHPVGFYILKHHRCPLKLDGESSELKQIYIFSREYGSGLGASLLEHAFEVARHAGRTWLWLCVSDTNHRAQSFYKKFGFNAIGPGPTLEVGTDRLASTLLVCKLCTQ